MSTGSRLLILLFLTILVMLPACSSTKKEKDPGIVLGSSTVVSSGDASLVAPPGAKFTWAADAFTLYDDPRYELQEGLKQMLQNAIVQTLMKKGYNFTADKAESNFQVGYIIALESSLGDNDLETLYGVQPGLVLSSDDYEKGTLIINIIDSKTNQTAWRGALQTQVDPKLSDETRRQRVNAAVERVLSRVPR